MVCTNGAVFLEDILVDDGKRLMVISKKLVDKVADEYIEMTPFGNFVLGKIAEARSIINQKFSKP